MNPYGEAGKTRAWCALSILSKVRSVAAAHSLGSVSLKYPQIETTVMPGFEMLTHESKGIAMKCCSHRSNLTQHSTRTQCLNSQTIMMKVQSGVYLTTVLP